MVKITHKPINEYVVYKCTKFSSPDDLTRYTIIDSGPMSPPHLKWINGVVYRVHSPGISIMTDLFTKDFMDGKLWIEVEFALMKEFNSTIKSIEDNVVIPVINCSNDLNDNSLVEWLLTQ